MKYRFTNAILIREYYRHIWKLDQETAEKLVSRINDIIPQLAPDKKDRIISKCYDLEMEDGFRTWDNVEKVDYVTKAQAMKTLKARWGDKGYLLDSLKTNPLPNSLVVKVKDLTAAEDTVTAVSALKGVEDVNYYKDTVDKLLKVTHDKRRLCKLEDRHNGFF